MLSCHVPCSLILCFVWRQDRTGHRTQQDRDRTGRTGEKHTEQNMGQTEQDRIEQSEDKEVTEGDRRVPASLVLSSCSVLSVQSYVLHLLSCVLCHHLCSYPNAPPTRAPSAPCAPGGLNLSHTHAHTHSHTHEGLTPLNHPTAFLLLFSASFPHSLSHQQIHLCFTRAWRSASVRRTPTKNRPPGTGAPRR